MGKNGSTKNKMLKMIAQGNKTLSDISKELDLAPSTVSQHLQELREIGAVKEVENEHVKKWKYYKLNPDFDYSSLGMDKKQVEGFREKIMEAKVFFYVIAIALAVTLAYFLIYGNANVQNSSFVPIRLTDPPIVPNDTQALYINYSSVSIHAVGDGSAEWIQSNASGKVNLMSLVNVSEIIAGAEVAHNQRIDGIMFQIDSAYIVINGSSYNVLVPSGEISTTVLGGGTVNSSSQVLVDFTPTVLAMYINGSTEFVMVPSVKAIASRGRMENSGQGNLSVIGERVKLNQNEVEALYNSENLSITSVSIDTEANGSTDFSVTVRNNGNSSIALSNILILGNQTPVTRLNITCGGSYAAHSQIAQWCRSIEDAGLNATSMLKNRSRSEDIIQTPLAEGGYIQSEFAVLPRIAYSRGIDFIVNGDGNMSLAYKGTPTNETYPYTPFNYTLGAGESKTFDFDGQLSLSGNLEIALVDGAHYRVAVLGEYGMHTLTNVTAS